MATETCLSSHSFGANITSLEVKKNKKRKKQRKHVVQGPPDMTSGGGRRTVFVDGNDRILQQVEDETSVEILEEFDPFARKSPPPSEETTEVMTLTQPKVIYDSDDLGGGDGPQVGILVMLPPNGDEIVNSDPNPIETETLTLALDDFDLDHDAPDPDADVDTARPKTRAKNNFPSKRKTNAKNPKNYGQRPWNGNSFAKALHLDDYETFIASRPKNGPRVSDIDPVGNIDDEDLCEDGPDSDEFNDDNLAKALQALQEQTQPFVVDTAGFREQTRWHDQLGPDESQSRPTRTQKESRPRRHNYPSANPQESSEVDFSDMPELELNYDDGDDTHCMQSEPVVPNWEVPSDEHGRGFHLVESLTSEQVIDNPEGLPENAPDGPYSSYYPEDVDQVPIARGATAYPTNHNNVGANATGREVNKKTTTTNKKKKKKKQRVVQGPPVTLDVGDGPTSPGRYDQVPNGLVTAPHADFPTEDDLVYGLEFGDIDLMGNFDDDDFREDRRDSESDESYDDDLEKAIQASKEQPQPFVVDTAGFREDTRWHDQLDSDDSDDDLFARGLQVSEEQAHPSASIMDDLSTALSNGRRLYRNRFADQDDMWTALEQDRELTWAQQETGGVGNTTGEDKKVVEFCDMELAMQLQMEENEQKRKHRSPFRRNNGMDQRRRDPPYRSVSSLLPPASRRGFRTPFEDMLTGLREQPNYTRSRRLQRDRELASGEQLLEGLSDYNDFSANDYEALLELEEKMGDAVHPGLSNSEIDRLPVSVYNTTPAEGATACGNSADAFSEHRACKICMCDYEDGDVIRTLPCYHRFHSECIDEWLGRNAVCPICRVKIKEEIGRVR